MSEAGPRVGVDVLDRSELRGLVERDWFLRFSYAPEELAEAESLGSERGLEFLTGRFAAKEAVLKVLGTGMLRGVPPRDICVERVAEGAPRVRFTGTAAELGPPPVALSIAHKENVVTAVAMSAPSQQDTAAAEKGREETGDMSGSEDDEGNTTAFLRVRIGQEDAHYGGGLVDGARILKLFGDLVTEITIRTDGDEGLLSEYAGVKLTAPVQPGDFIEASAELVRKTRLRRVVELRAHKVIAADPSTRDSAAEALEEPVLVGSATATTVIPARAKAAAKEN